MPARAQTGPVIAIPGKPGVPVTINGVIVDGAVIYGDWGLARPGHGAVVIEGPVDDDRHARLAGDRNHRTGLRARRHRTRQ